MPNLVMARKVLVVVGFKTPDRMTVVFCSDA
jgi:hypothetical protein